MEKLTIEHLAPYLPYGLKGISKEENLGIEVIKGYSTYGKNNSINLTTNVDDIDIEMFKPILIPLSDYKDVNSERLSEINTDLMNQIEITEFANKQSSIASLSYSSFMCLIKDHADVFGLLEKGLAVDYNTI